MGGWVLDDISGQPGRGGVVALLEAASLLPALALPQRTLTPPPGLTGFSTHARWAPAGLWAGTPWRARRRPSWMQHSGRGTAMSWRARWHRRGSSSTSRVTSWRSR